MGLSAFIRANEEAIVLEWQAFAQIYLPSAEHMDRTALRDHIFGLLRFVADDLQTHETEKERSDKSKGQGSKGGKKPGGAAGTHGELRFAAGFDTIEMISEFRALRASVIKLWRAQWTQVDDVLPDLLRFNEAIDQVMTESLLRFVENGKNSGSRIIKILKKNACDPLREIQNSADKLLNNAKLDVKEIRLIANIAITSCRISGIVSGVIDTIGASSGTNQPGFSLPTASKRKR